MRLKKLEGFSIPNKLFDVTIVINRNKIIKLTKRQIYELFFEYCINCNKMAAIPQGAFAVRKIREMNEHNVLQMDLHIKSSKGKGKDHRRGSFKKNLTEEREPTPLKYNSKLMNSIWGEYNRYSVHNFKKNTAADEKKRIFTTAWGSILLSNTSSAVATTNIVADMKHHV